MKKVKLSLRRETLRTLTPAEEEQAAGGTILSALSCSCPSMISCGVSRCHTDCCPILS